MLDIRLFRENPDLVRQALTNRYEDPGVVDQVLSLDARRRELQTQIDSARGERNTVSAQIPQIKDPAAKQERIAAMRALGGQIDTAEAELRQIEDRQRDLLLSIPNIPDASVPIGKDDTENIVLRHWSEPPRFAFTPRPHWEIAEALGIADFDRGAKISGSRFYVLVGAGAALERALISFFLDVHTMQHGYREVWTPYLVRRECMIGTAQLPKFEEDMYHSDDDLFLEPTAEVPITNLYRDEILDAGRLPIYLVGQTACFRKEAGSAGRDTRGMIRVHQFNKVEMVKFVAPDTSYDELEKLVGNAEHVLQMLDLPYRIAQMCTGDVGFAAAKKYDPEVWMPGQENGQGKYVEISSCSNFLDFQARRANIRYRPTAEARPQFVHTLNGSGLAVGRSVAAVLENYQQADGRVLVPAVLQPYMHGRTEITPERGL